MTSIRLVDPRRAAAHRLGARAGGLHPLLARLFAARGVRHADELDDALARLLPPAGLLGAATPAVLLADAIGAGSRICVGSPTTTATGATACAVAPARPAHARRRPVDALLRRPRPARPRLRADAADRRPRARAIGPSADDGRQRHREHRRRRPRAARRARVVITDHHLPLRDDDGAVLPEADVIVNPNQPGCAFASKHLAGVGVAFYVLLALRAELRAASVDVRRSPAQPRLACAGSTWSRSAPSPTSSASTATTAASSRKG
jgi:single-stranded-DNA-specific exonuclease